jgi:hypothetical protein
VEGALVDGVEAGLIAMDEGQLGARGDGPEGGGEAADLVAGGLLGDGVVDDAGFDGPGAPDAPTGGEHFFEQAVLDAASGTEAVHELVVHLAEAFGELIGEDQTLSEQAMADGVLRGTGFTLGRDRTTRASAVGAGG